MPRIVEQRKAPDASRSLTTITDPDYVDFFTAATGGVGERSPEQWARAAFDQIAGIRGQFAWRVVLGLRLERRPENVAGWRIGDRGDDWIRLETSSWCMTAHAVVHIDEERVSVALFIRYDRPIAAAIWRAASIVHRRAMPGLLRGTVKCLASNG